MKIHYALFVCVLLLASSSFAREKSDIIIMKNGDHLTCEIKGLDAGALYVSFDYIIGTQSLEWAKIDRIESKQLFIVKTADGSAYTGMIKALDNASAQPVKIEVLPEQGKGIGLQRSEVVTMTQTSDKFFSRFNGEINSGVIYSKGNQSTQYTLSAAVEYPRERWVAGLNYDSTLSSSTGADTSTRNSLGINAFRLLPSKNWFYGGLGTFLQSSEQSIDLQTNMGGGIGHYFKNTNRSKIYLMGGLAWQHTTYVQSVTAEPSQNVASALVVAGVNFFKFNKTTLTFDVGMFPALSQPGRVFTNVKASYYIKILPKLTWNISFYGNWDNQPPPFFSGSDYGTSSGLGLTFGNR